MSNWISVTEQLPDPDQWVIYHAPGIFSSKSPQMWIGKCDNGVFYSKAGFFGCGEVEYWMPLPSLPLTEAEKKELARPKCSVCGTKENVRWMGGYQPWLCDSRDCIPF
jgi:hypothetical protein